MRIDPEKCIGCLLCLDYCPACAILVGVEGLLNPVFVDHELCFECGLCRRLKICPVDAFEESIDVDKFPRVVRTYFSNPNTTHKLTMVPGRGTEESKTNDVTGRIKRGELGVCIEFGRPGLGSTFRDISLMTTRLKTLGVQFEQNNPLTELMDSETGNFDTALLSERILSAIIEIRLESCDELSRVIPVIMEVAKVIDTVFSLSVISRFDESGELPVLRQLADLGISYAPNAKINLGMGKPIVDL